MSELRKYAGDALFYFPLIEDGDADFVTDYTPAAGDAKIFTDKLISTNPTALILGFDSLSEIPAQGAQLDENGAGTAEGVVAFTVIISGTVGGGDAAGFFFMRSVTGEAWTNNDQIDINGGTANIATADSTTYDLAATAGLIASIGNGLFAACLSPTEMTCAQGQINIVDSSTKAIEDQAVQLHTYGNAAALHAIDLDDSVRAGLTALPDAAADAAGGLPISDLGGLDVDTLFSNITAILADTGTTLDDLVDDLEARLGTPSDFGSGTSTIAANLQDLADNGTASFDRSTDSLQALRDHIADGTNLSEAGATGNHLSAIPWNAAWDAEVQSEVDDALKALGLDHLVSASVIGADVVDNSIIAKMVSKEATADWDDFVNTTESLQALRDHIGDGTNLTEAGATGNHLTAIPWNAAWDAEVESEVNDALDTAIPELPVAAPSATPSLRTAIMLPYMGARNKRLVDATADEYYNDAGVIICSAVLSDDTIEMISGELA